MSYPVIMCPRKPPICAECAALEGVSLNGPEHPSAQFLIATIKPQIAKQRANYCFKVAKYMGRGSAEWRGGDRCRYAAERLWMSLMQALLFRRLFHHCRRFRFARSGDAVRKKG
jgi:hypothetical protein